MAQQGYFRLEAKIISRAKGHSAIGAAAYRTGTKRRDDRTGKIYDFTRKQDIYHHEVMAPANVPAWAFDSETLWRKVEEIEWTDNRKKNTAQLAREIVLCFPQCLTHEEKVAVTRAYIQKEYVSRGMVADVAFHSFTGKEAHNPHAHVMLTLRTMNERGFEKKNRDWNSDQLLENWREQWAHHLNQYLERGGYEVRVDHRSYEAQGIDRAPTIHEGKAATRRRRRGESTQVTERNDEIKHLNQELERAQAELRQEEIREAWRQKHREERLTRKLELKQQAAQEQNNQLSPPDIAQLAKTAQQAIAPTLQVPSAQSPVVQPTMKQEPPSETTPPLSDKEPTPSSQQRQEQKRGGGGNGQEPPEPPYSVKYYTWHNVKKQLEAMGGDGRFDIGIGTRNPETGKIERMEVLRQQWQNQGYITKEQILHYDPKTGKTPIIDALKGENANGKEIFIRLAPTADGKQQGLFLVDDIDQVTIDDMKDRGIIPALVVETSHKNCQVWIRVTQSGVEKETATQVAKLLAKEYGGDPASASYQHFGRLAGFTNQKETHRNLRTGKFPFVKVLAATGALTPQGEQWLERARAAVAQAQENQQQAAVHRERLGNQPVTERQLERALHTFTTTYEKYWQQRTVKDYSKSDWAVLKHMVKRLGWTNEEVLRYALRHGSPDLEKRKAGHTDDYVNRTITKLFQEKDVLEAIASRQQRQQARRQQHSRPQPEVTPKEPSSQTTEPLHPAEQDQRQLIEQWQQFKDAAKERSKPASDGAKHPTRQPEDGKPLPSSGDGPSKDTLPPTLSPSASSTQPSAKSYRQQKAPLYHTSYFRWQQAQNLPPQEPTFKIDPSTANLTPTSDHAEVIGELDSRAVAYIIQLAKASKNCAAQLRKATWALSQDTSKWQQCKAEYLKEWGRMQRAFGKLAVLTPNTDIEIVLKLRRARFSYAQIFQVLCQESPLATSFSSREDQLTYWNKAILPYLRQQRSLINSFHYERERQAKKLHTDPAKQQAHIAEKRLDKLGLATPVEPKPTQQQTPRQQRPSQHRPPQQRRDDPEQER